MVICLRIYNYIFWDITNENIVFNNCPSIHEGFVPSMFIYVNQQIDQTINQFEHYRISFTHTIDALSTATLAIYYYNSDGWGFKISGIDSDSGVGGVFTQDVVIGELDGSGDPITGSKWSSVNTSDSTFNANLKNSFVIEVEGDEGDFINGSVVKSGQKYIKIMSGNGGTVGGSCWGFIVKEDTKNFKKGDILKPAGYNAPARNFARGNVFDGGYEIRWTGA